MLLIADSFFMRCERDYTDLPATPSTNWLKHAAPLVGIGRGSTSSSHKATGSADPNRHRQAYPLQAIEAVSRRSAIVTWDSLLVRSTGYFDRTPRERLWSLNTNADGIKYRPDTYCIGIGANRRIHLAKDVAH